MAVNKNLAGSFGNYGFLTSDNPNAWKARSEGAILSEKAYGNPAMNPANATTFADQTFKGDPWYALGRMIGAGYMQNYNERGINKNIDAANEAIKGTYGDLSGTGTQQQQPQATAQPIQYNNNVPTDYTYQGRENKGELIQPRDQMAMEKREYFVDKYSGSPNPTSDSINKANAEAQAQAEAERINGLRKLDPVMMYNLAADAIKKRGGTKYQQDMALAQIREQIGGYMASANKQVFDYDSKEVEDMISNGDYKGAWGKWAGLAKLDPDRAKILYSGIPTMKDIWANDRQKELMAMRAAGGYGSGGYSGRNRNGNSSSNSNKAIGSPVKPGDLNSLLKTRDYYEARAEMGPLSQEDSDAYENVKYQINQLAGLLGNGRKINAPDDVYFNDANSAEYDDNGNLLRYGNSKSLNDILEESKVYNNPTDRLEWIAQKYPDVYRYLYNHNKTVNDYK